MAQVTHTKKSIQAELILASLNQVTRDIIYTFKLTFPRMILPEVNTHTVASKNTSSSRAIPVPKLMRMVWKDPFIPYQFGTYQKGMQAGPALKGFKLWLARTVWKCGRLADLMEALFDHYVLKLAKEVTNRIYERFIWTEQIFSTTDLSNLLHLRNHWMAEPHFQVLAHQMAEIKDQVDKAMSIERGEYMPPGTDSTIWAKCQILKPNEWHLPFIGKWKDVKHLADLDTLKKVSAARCAWVSYFMPGDNAKKMYDFAPALDTYNKLAGGDPKHLSPLQHPSTPIPQRVRVGNYCGFLQFRKQVPGESGGDIVVPSITPTEAERLLKEYEMGKIYNK